MKVIICVVPLTCCWHCVKVSGLLSTVSAASTSASSAMQSEMLGSNSSKHGRDDRLRYFNFLFSQFSWRLKVTFWCDYHVHLILTLCTFCPLILYQTFTFNGVSLQCGISAFTRVHHVTIGSTSEHYKSLNRSTVLAVLAVTYKDNVFKHLCRVILTQQFIYCSAHAS